MKLLNAWNKLSLVKRIIIGVIQDSCETALNSSSDVLFTASAEYYLRRKAQTNN